MARQQAATGLRERKKQRTRDQIVAAARELFVERGYEAATVIDIADRVDIAVSTLFGYFPTKADLLFAGYDEIVEDFVRAIELREPGESAIDATVRWHTAQRMTTSHAPVAADRLWWSHHLRQIIESDPVLEGLEHQHYVRAEERLAREVARDLGDAEDALRPQLISATKVALFFRLGKFLAQGGAGDADADDYGEYVDRCLRAAADAIESVPLPRAAGHLRSVS